VRYHYGAVGARRIWRLDGVKRKKEGGVKRHLVYGRAILCGAASSLLAYRICNIGEKHMEGRAIRWRAASAVSKGVDIALNMGDRWRRLKSRQ